MLWAAPLLPRQAALEVAGEAGDGEYSARLAREVTPDVVLIDIPVPDTDGPAATRQIAADGQLASVRVVILTTFVLDEYVFEAIRSGASEFLVKDSEPEERAQAVRVLVGGDALTLVSGARPVARRVRQRLSPGRRGNRLASSA